jgi:hypothetical protein
MYVRFPLSLRNVEDLLFERGIDLCHLPNGQASEFGCDQQVISHGRVGLLRIKQACVFGPIEPHRIFDEQLELQFSALGYSRYHVD